MEKTFPQGFLWGGATSAHQYEGGRDEGGLSGPDMMSGGSRTAPRHITSTIRPEYHYPTEEAVDFYHRYKEDIALYAEMGFKEAPRISRFFWDILGASLHAFAIVFYWCHTGSHGLAVAYHVSGWDWEPSAVSPPSQGLAPA